MPSTSTNSFSNRVGQSSWALGGLVAATTLSVVLSLNAWAKDEVSDAPPPPPAAQAPEAWHGGGPGMMPFAGKRFERALSDVGATSAQRDQINKIVAGAGADLKALHEQGRGFHEQALKLWAAPVLDAGAAEQLRQKMQAHHDQMSKRMLDLALKVGQVLTPEQRAKLAQRMQHRHEGGRHEGHGDHPHPRDN